MRTKPAPNPPAAARERPISTAAAGQTLANGTRKPRLSSTHARSARSTKRGSESLSIGDSAFPRGHCLLLGVLAMAHAASATVFATKATLSAALVEFCGDQAAAEATHGTIGSWDVTAVTDMKDLMSGFSPCKATFNADVSGWDTSSVTNMYMMFYVRSARALQWGPPCILLSRLPPHALPSPACMLPSSHASLLPWQETSVFNQPLSFDTSSVTSMFHMFLVRFARVP